MLTTTVMITAHKSINQHILVMPIRARVWQPWLQFLVHWDSGNGEVIHASVWCPLVPRK